MRNLYFIFVIVFSAGLLTAIPAAPGASGKVSPPGRPKTKLSPQVKEAVRALQAERDKLDETVWAQEVLAQEYGDTFVAFWDQLRATEDPYEVLVDFPFEGLQLGRPVQTETHDWGITVTRFEEGGRSLNQQEWREFLTGWKKQGYRIEYSEWHQERFEQAPSDPARSVYAFSLHVRGPEETRFIIKGLLKILWSSEKDGEGRYLVRNIAVEEMKISGRKGQPAFQSALVVDGGGDSVVYLYDLNRDGLSEIVIPSSNLLLWNRGQGRLERDRFSDHLPKVVLGGVFADFTGDGLADFLCLGGSGQVIPGLLLFRGDGEGRFGTPPESANDEALEFRTSLCLTAGDVDKDGDLDVWLTQYRPPYFPGEMPTPYYDSNDGFPSYLLSNQGEGKFMDITEKSGLAKKRFRRTYSASFVDLDRDQDLDLIVVSDFAGVDIYENDGRGRFTDVTDRVIDESANFGMSHTFGDYNQDGLLDFYVVGMSSTTARRLDAMHLGREGFSVHQRMRAVMGHGNRMYLATGKRTFRQPTFQDQVARSGWSWGSTSFDFDSDGDLDIYVANGHASKKTAKDYCSLFWRHDIYTKTPKESLPHRVLLSSEWAKNMKTMSWNPFEANHLFMNENGKSFMNVAYLMGVADDFDGRSVISDDLNIDGKPDLVVLGADPRDRKHYSLHVFLNQWSEPNNWIGVRLYEEPGRSPIGAVATVRYAGGGQTTVPFVTGDSSAAQHSHLKHFGLGRQSRVEALEVRWLDGKEKRIPNPAINQYHDILYSESKSISDSRTRHIRTPRSALAKRGVDQSGGGTGL